MTRTLYPIALSAVFSLTAGFAFAGQGDRIKEADACGYVVDSTGSVVSEATVKAVNGDKTLATATTLSDGSFHFEESIGSGITLQVQAHGMAPASELIDRIKPAKGDRKCGKPIYVVLAQENGLSFITNKKNRVPKVR